MDTATANWRSILGSGKIFVKIVCCCKLEDKFSRQDWDMGVVGKQNPMLCGLLLLPLVG